MMAVNLAVLTKRFVRLLQAPLEAAAVTLFKEIAASRTRQELNIGSKYTGDEDWLAGF